MDYTLTSDDRAQLLADLKDAKAQLRECRRLVKRAIKNRQPMIHYVHQEAALTLATRRLEQALKDNHISN